MVSHTGYLPRRLALLFRDGWDRFADADGLTDREAGGRPVCRRGCSGDAAACERSSGAGCSSTGSGGGVRAGASLKPRGAGALRLDAVPASAGTWA